MNINISNAQTVILATGPSGEASKNGGSNDVTHVLNAMGPDITSTLGKEAKRSVKEEESSQDLDSTLTAMVAESEQESGPSDSPGVDAAADASEESGAGNSSGEGDVLTPEAAADAKAASETDAKAAQDPVTWNGGTLTETQKSIVATLSLYKDRGYGEISLDDLAEMKNRDDIPDDLKAALQALDEDHGLFKAIGSQGDGKFGGKIKAKDLVEFSQNHAQVLTWNGGRLNNEQLQIMAVLDRHKDKCPIDWESVREKSQDTTLPSDLRAALAKLADNPELFFAIGSQGDGKCGGKITQRDLAEFSQHHSQVGEFMEAQAKSFTQNYIASDARQGDGPSRMTQADALRELYRYSDSLGKNLDYEYLRKLTRGEAESGKCPPQVIAAAQYFLDHRDQWEKLNNGSSSVSKADFLQSAVSNMNLTREELDTLDTINKNPDAFFKGGNLTRERLAELAEDKSLSDKERAAAKHLLADPLLFGVINNANSGYKTKHSFFTFRGPTVDSGVISRDDFNKFYQGMSATNKEALKHEPLAKDAAVDANAVKSMCAGVEDQPEIKAVKKSGGFLKHVLDTALNIAGKVLDIGSMVIGSLSFIPGLGQIADLVSMAMAAEAQACKILKTIIDGGNIKKALIEAGINMAAAGVGLIAGPEARIALRNGLAEIVVNKALNAGISMAVSEAQQCANEYLMDLKDRLTTSASLSFSNVMGAMGAAAKDTANYAGDRLKTVKDDIATMPQTARSQLDQGKAALEKALTPGAEFETWKNTMQYA